MPGGVELNQMTPALLAPEEDVQTALSQSISPRNMLN